MRGYLRACQVWLSKSILCESKKFIELRKEEENLFAVWAL